MDNNKKVSTIKQAATGGLILGFTVSILSLVQYWLFRESVLYGFIQFFIYIFILYYLAFRYSIGLKPKDCSYVQAFGYIMLVSIFGGIISSSFGYIQTNIIDPKYYSELTEQLLSKMSDMPEDKLNEVYQIQQKLMANPIMAIVAGTISSVMRSSIMGLIIAAFVKRKENNILK